MHRFRLLFVLWAGMIFCGVCSAQAQESSIDTVHLFTPHADTVRLGFEDMLPLSATGDTKFHYLYRWTSNEKKIGEENVLNYSFSGERKAKVTGQRFSTALPWPGEHYIDMEYFKNGGKLLVDFMDTVYLKAFSEYESDSTATWIWTIKKMWSDREYTLFGSRVKITIDKDPYNCIYTVTCILQTETGRRYYSPLGEIDFLSPGVFGKENSRLIDNVGGGVYTINVFDKPFNRIYAHKDDTIFLDGRIPDPAWSDADISWEYREGSYHSPSLLIFF